MRWQGRAGSSNVEDARGSGGGGMGPGMVGGGGLGCFGVIVVIIIMLMGGNPSDYIDMGGGTQTQQQPQDTQNSNAQVEDGSTTEQVDERKQFASVVLKDTEDVWHKIFQDHGRTYTEPKLLLYSGAVNSGCGQASSQMGPFYCPADQKVYIDLSFIDELDQKFDAPGDFAMAYVIAHEVGHHVQNELGILPKFHQLRNQMSEKEYNKYSVAVELQADYFAGVYAKYAEKMGYTEQGDLEEAINAAEGVGDDTIQGKYMGGVNPDSFTHGSSADRMKWFKKGYESGDLNGGDTFGAMGLDF